MDDVSDLENIGEQFRFLLQPVRDLAKNWDIDIKHYLEDYLNKLAQEHDNELDARGKRKIFNFAEAAVVIDGSTNIYCRKVDYLLQQAQDYFTEISMTNEKKKKRKATTEEGEQDGGGTNGGEGDGADDEDDEMGDSDEVRRRKNPYLQPISEEAEENMRAQLQKLSKRRPCFPIVPLAFTPLMDFEKSDVVLYHRGSEKKALEMIGKKDDFKVNTCIIVDGVALIDLKNFELLDMFSHSFHTPTATRDSIDIQSLGDGDSVAESQQSQPQHGIPVGNPFDDLDIGDDLENIDPNDGGDYFDFTDNELAVEYKDITGSVNSTQPKGDLVNSQIEATIEPASQPNEEQRMSVLFNEKVVPALSLDEYSQNSLHAAATAVANGVPLEPDVRTQSSVGFSLSSMEYDRDTPYNLRPSSMQMDENFSEQHPTRKSRKELVVELEEPFEPMNPMEERNSKSRPFQIDKRCVTNALKQIKQRDKRIEKECKEKGVPNISTVKDFIDTRIFGRKIRKKSHVFASFNSFLFDRALLAVNAEFYAEQERRSAIRKQRNETEKMKRRLARRTSQRTSIVALEHKDSVARFSNFCGVARSPPRYEDPIEELGADEVIDYNCEAPDDPHAEDRPLGDLLDVEDLGEQSFMAYDDYYEDANRTRRRSALIRNDNIYDDTIYVGSSMDYPDELPPRPLSQMEYNDLVEYHLKKYWTIKEESTTKFAERVRDWENKVNPLLDKELDHDAFNTRIYSTRLIEGFGNEVGSEIDFEKFARNTIGVESDNYNLSRYLLVSLILTNMQNVEIVDSDVNRLKLRLTKLERHDEMFDDEQRLITGGE